MTGVQTCALPIYRIGVGLAISIAIDEPCNYHVKLRSLFNDNQTVDKSATYVNTTSFENVGELVTTETRYQETFASTISYRDAGKVMLPSGPVETPLASESA